jgi:hypothetical protein
MQENGNKNPKIALKIAGRTSKKHVRSPFN